jgi:hypothetical protein
MPWSMFIQQGAATTAANNSAHSSTSRLAKIPSLISLVATLATKILRGVAAPQVSVGRTAVFTPPGNRAKTTVRA